MCVCVCVFIFFTLLLTVGLSLKFPSVSRTPLSTLFDFDNGVVWMVSILSLVHFS